MAFILVITRYDLAATAQELFTRVVLGTVEAFIGGTRRSAGAISI